MSEERSASAPSVARRSIASIAGWAFFVGTALFATIHLPSVGGAIEFEGAPPWMTMRRTVRKRLTSRWP